MSSCDFRFTDLTSYFYRHLPPTNTTSTSTKNVKKERQDELVENHLGMNEKQLDSNRNKQRTALDTAAQQRAALSQINLTSMISSLSSSMANELTNRRRNNTTNNNANSNNNSTVINNHDSTHDNSNNMLNPSVSITNVRSLAAIDEDSVKGRFGWDVIGNNPIPYISRSGEKYCAVRVVELKIVDKYIDLLHEDIYNCTCIRSYYITDAESRLLNEINFKHCDCQFGRDYFTVQDLMVRLSDAIELYHFLVSCFMKLSKGGTDGESRSGFIRINKESVVPYTIYSTHKYVPLFYFEGETDNLKQRANKLDGWDLAYLKFCCKVQGIRNELFSHDSCSVISLNDIKNYFPLGTLFEDYWPSKNLDSQLLLSGDVPRNNVSHQIKWTRRPAAPPTAAVALGLLSEDATATTPIPQLTQQQSSSTMFQSSGSGEGVRHVPSAFTALPSSMVQQQTSSATSTSPKGATSRYSPNMAQLTNAQAMAVNHVPAVYHHHPYGGSPTSHHPPQQQCNTVAAAVAQSQLKHNNTTNTHGRSGNSQASFSSASSSTSTASSTSSRQGRNTSPYFHYPSRLTPTPPSSALMSQHGGGSQPHSAIELHSHYNLPSMLVNNQPAHQQPSTNSRLQPQQLTSASATYQSGIYYQSDDHSSVTTSPSPSLSNGGQPPTLDHINCNLLPIPEVSPNTSLLQPFKVSRAMIQNKALPCINLEPFIYNDVMVALPDLIVHFFNNVPLEMCQRVMRILGIDLYRPNNLQLQLLMEPGACLMPNEIVPLVRVRPVIDLMPQLKYMCAGVVPPMANRHLTDR